jgi:hypothetical protein
MNRATADNQSAQSEEEGLEPTKEWVKDLVDEIIAQVFASPAIEGTGNSDPRVCEFLAVSSAERAALYNLTTLKRVQRRTASGHLSNASCRYIYPPQPSRRI